MGRSPCDFCGRMDRHDYAHCEVCRRIDCCGGLSAFMDPPDTPKGWQMDVRHWCRDHDDQCPPDRAFKPKSHKSE